MTYAGFKMLITDLDGTLLRDDRTVSDTDYRTLVELGGKNIVRVVATGRSLYSLDRVLSPDFPVDYIIFSCGAGLYDWRKKKILYSRELDASQIGEVTAILLDREAPFMIHLPVPDNQYFYFRGESDPGTDFGRRLELYPDCSAPLRLPVTLPRASQIVSILPPDKFDRFLELKSRIRRRLGDGVSLVRATSPIDHRSHWLEIFHPDISKAKTAAELGRRLGMAAAGVRAVGNDYNDRDLLQWAGSAFLVENAPADLKAEFETVSANGENGFTEAVYRKPD